MARKPRTPAYVSWCAMRYRCLNKNGHAYHIYGGRGITICQRWIDSFDNFMEDMGERPTPQHTLDRLDSDRDYEPSNCRWATRLEQGENRRTNCKIEFNGEVMSISAWSRRIGIPKDTLRIRLKVMSVEEAFTRKLLEPHEVTRIGRAGRYGHKMKSGWEPDASPTYLAQGGGA